ncbi:DNA-binding GntR family transcriptional regulator [Tamaricihabitans halophyticus]|uniref:DNA-binding GntR family transcriptional regulator n=1 Tax=Tamaricihabitans halophyticus TaxID=1262583 RepID=A0A4R2QU95_9PSEU|nr:GntR family transcriptional regulator [Tamaricihabitans halophyticus]TCP53530.1 DNA-binding GntR family transcriptional regulator [Tamaricihabitans halophyticus]
MRSTVNKVGSTHATEDISLAERAFRTIRDRLVLLDIPPGAAINDVLLANELHLGRTPVREALKRLESERLVVAYPRRGTFATDVNITDLAHISEVRLQLEPVAAAAAATRLRADDRVALTDLLAELDSHAPQPPAEAMLRLDLRIHRAMYAATHNPYLEDTLVRYDNLATRIWCLFLDRLSGVAGHINEHGPLLRAILAGDESGARDLAAIHVKGFERAVHEAI